MKRFFAGLVAAAMAASVLPLTVSADGITAQKTNYIVGTSGKLSGGSNYSSSADDIVSVESDGTITAVAPGTATISSDSGSVDITVHDKAKADLISDMATEFKEHDVDFGSANRFTEMQNALPESNIWGYSGYYYSIGYLTNYYDNDINALISYSGPAGDNFGKYNWTGLIYKPDFAVGGADIQLYYRKTHYSAQDIANTRVYVGYRTDDYSWQTDRSNTLSGIRGANGNGSRQYDLAGVISTSGENESNGLPKLNTDVWTQVKITEANIKSYDANKYDMVISTKDIPSNAKYVVVMVNNGELDNVESIYPDPLKLGVRGVTLHSEKSLAAGEVTADNKIALTYNGDTENPSLTVKKNGNDVETNVTYDAATYTSYIDGAFSAGDYIEVTSSEGYNWSGTIPGEPVDTDYDNVYFSTERTVYVEGTTGKIDLIAKKGNETWKNPVDTTYVSSNEDVVKVDNDGNITAVSAGTAVITPSVDSMPDRTFGTVTVNVYTPSTVESFITDEIDAGKLDFKYDPRSDLMSSRLHGSKLKAYTLSSEPAKHEGYVFSTYTSYDAYMGFVYKLEGEVESIKTEDYIYGDDYINEIEKRTVIGYLTDDTKEFCNPAEGVTYTWNSENLSMYGVAGGVLDKPSITESEVLEIDPIWTVLGEQYKKWEKGVIEPDKRDATLTATGIPADAKYAVVLINLGKLSDGTAAAPGDHIRYKGATINYKKKLLDGTLNEDNKAVLTFNTSARDVALNITKNGAAAENPTVTYSADGYTAYVDAGLTSGDEISVTTDYGSFEQQVSDDREQIESISVTDGDGTPIEMLTPNEPATVNVKASVINTDDQKLTVYAALYDESGNLVKISSGNAVTAAQKATAEATLEIDEVPVAATLRIFAWGDNMNPFTIYNDIQTKFETEDF